VKAVSKGILSIATFNMAKIAASALSAPVLARVLGADGYGQYAYYVAMIVMAWPFANLGTSHILAKYIAERSEDLRWRSSLASFSATMNILGALSVGIILVLVDLSSSIVDSRQIFLTILVVGAIILEQAWFFSRGVLHGVRREELANLPAALGAVTSAVLGVALALLGMGLLGVMAGILIANLTVAIVTLKYISRFVKWRFSRDLLRRLPVWKIMRFGISSTFYLGLALVLYRADVILLRHLSGDSEAGLYAAAVQWSESAWFIPMAVQEVMLQSTSRLWAEKRVSEITDLLSRLLRYVALGTAFLLTVVFVFADRILGIYFGAEFVDACLALRILIPGVFGFSLARVMWPVMQARGNVLALVVAIAAAVTANLTLNWYLIPKWGRVGAAVATSLSYGSVVFAYVWIIQSWGVRPFKGLHGGRFLLLCIVTMAVSAPATVFIPSALAAIVVGSLVAACVYGVGALWLGLVGVVEIRHIIESLPGPLRSSCAKVFTILKPMLVRVEIGLFARRTDL
jgi:O-antigen/teichoic acid export membrane protein